MRFSTRTLAAAVMVAASLLVSWAAIAAPVPHIDGVAAADDPSGAGRILLVIGRHLTNVRTFELRTATNEHVADLPVIHQSRSLALLGLPAAQAPGTYALVYTSRSQARVAVVQLVAPAEKPEPCPCPDPPPCPLPPTVPLPGPYVRAAGGDIVTGTIIFATAQQAIVASSGTTNTTSGGIDSTASYGIGIAGHGNIGVLGDVDDTGYDSPRVGVLGSASSYSSIGVSGVNDAQGPAIQTGPGVQGRSRNGTGVFGITDIGGWSYYEGSTYYPTDAVGVKALAKGGYSTALAAEAQGANSTGLRVNHSGGSGDVAVFQADGTNCARIALDGTGYFNGGTVSSGADFAEGVATDAPAKDFEPGDVVVIDATAPRRFSLCRTPESKLVAGVVSTRPALLGSVHDVSGVGRDALEKEIRLGIVGIVPTKVCDEGGPIRIGDMLVSASVPGHAMRAPDKPATGTVIGKALGALERGRGRVEVLLTQR